MWDGAGDLADILLNIGSSDAAEIRWFAPCILVGVLAGFASHHAPIPLAPDARVVTWLVAPTLAGAGTVCWLGTLFDSGRLRWCFAWGFALGLSFALTRHLA